MIAAHFGESAPFSLGVEEELMILDVATLDQLPGVDRILRGVEGLELPGRLKTELFASVFEINTDQKELPVLISKSIRPICHSISAGTHPKLKIQL